MKANDTINSVLRQVIPKPHRFRATLEDTGVGRYQVLRVVTPAWKTTPRFKRILKVQEAIDAHLPRRQLEKILRVSVLTSDEYKRLCFDLKTTRQLVRGGNGNGH